MKISVIVTLKDEVLDPQGKVISDTIRNMGINNINDIRQGKFFEIKINEKDFKDAEKKIEEICKKLLANPVIENYKIINNK